VVTGGMAVVAMTGILAENATALRSRTVCSVDRTSLPDARTRHCSASGAEGNGCCGMLRVSWTFGFTF